MSLARQMLLLQLGIVVVVLVGVTAVSVAELNSQHRATAGRQALAVAEYVASNSGVRHAVSTDGEAYLSQAAGTIASSNSFSGSSSIVVARRDGTVIASTDPLPEPGRPQPTLRRTDAFLGRSWVGTDDGGGAAVAMVPVISETTRETDGVVAVSRAYPSALENLDTALPNLLTYLGVASLLGVAGSLLMSRRLKRQTLGLEPREITGLVEHREALLSGIKEGVVAVDLARRLTLVNHQAAHLLGIPLDAVGRTVDEADPSGQLSAIFTDTDAPTPTDRVLPVGRGLLTVNRMPVRSHCRLIGWVATLRDRTELLQLQRELDLNRSTTDVLRSQAHEFSNRMHVVNGMIALGEFAEVRQYVREITNAQAELATTVLQRVEDPAVSALLMAKTSQAAERGVAFVIDDNTRVPRLDPGLSADVNTVLGNLVDNALDAALAGSSREPTVRVRVAGGDDLVEVMVRDSGMGIGPDVAEEVFRRGYSTKPASEVHGRGIGLALVRVVCRSRGGDVEVHNDGGAVFVATLPARVPSVSA